jgi:SAM-dependent methyltransferase
VQAFANERVIDNAIGDMVATYKENTWLTETMWPLVGSHVRLMLADAMRLLPPEPDVSVLDVGCFNGYISYLFKRVGYRVTGADIAALGDRDAIFAREGIGFIETNFNNLTPFPHVEDGSFDIVVIAQVIEHVLNHPVGLTRELARITRDGGLLLLTTPHPATLMNAARILLNKWSLWGTREFIDLPKIEQGVVISHGEIHYREYLTEELHYMIRSSGYDIVSTKYLGLGPTPDQPLRKRLLKNAPFVDRLMSTRLFGSNQYILARKEGPGKCLDGH